MRAREASRDKKAYRLARKLLLKFKDQGVTEEILEEYAQNRKKQPRTISGADGLYFRILSSAQNAGMKPKVIGKAIGGIRNLGKVQSNLVNYFIAQG